MSVIDFQSYRRAVQRRAQPGQDKQVTEPELWSFLHNAAALSDGETLRAFTRLAEDLVAAGVDPRVVMYCARRGAYRKRNEPLGGA
ncbi:MAG: hypothetical protein JSW10_06955 [Pseudomonadota bacterium]|nr:MAG: hypothetical protein JSW10_06955 [Pseudomonadota bacterium]